MPLTFCHWLRPGRHLRSYRDCSEFGWLRRGLTCHTDKICLNTVSLMTIQMLLLPPLDAFKTLTMGRFQSSVRGFRKDITAKLSRAV